MCFVPYKFRLVFTQILKLAMALDRATFEALVPSRFITFTFPNPISGHLLRVAVLDSPTPATDSPRVAAMLVPHHREHDWIFSTLDGHLQLLLSSPSISRLILAGDLPAADHCSPVIYNRSVNADTESYLVKLQGNLMPLLLALSPKSFAENGSLEIPFLSYDDNVIGSVIVEKCVGSCVGEMLVEDVEIESTESKREFRRRLRFKRMPNLIQTEVSIVPAVGSGGIGEVEFRLDLGVLVHPYLAPMAASLCLICSYIEERIRTGFTPKALCVGVGGGALLSFLQTQLGFEVFGVEADEIVLSVAERYFGLEVGETIRVFVGDGIEVIEKIGCRVMERNLGSFGVHEVENPCFMNDINQCGTKFDVIMVDLDSSDVCNGVSAPPLDFVQRSVLLSARSALCKLGIFVINVIPPNRSFHEMLIHEFREVFHELYEIDVGNGENYVLIATVSPIDSTLSGSENAFLVKLKRSISGAYMDSIRKI